MFMNLVVMRCSSQKTIGLEQISQWKVFVHQQCGYTKTLLMACTEYGVHAAKDTFLHLEAYSSTPSMMPLKKSHMHQYFIE